MPEFGAACADGAAGAITPTTAIIDAAMSALVLMRVPSLAVRFLVEAVAGGCLVIV
jgi:hypothetical protein